MVEAAGLLEADDLVRAALGERRSMRSMTSASVEAASITSTHGTSSAGTDEERAGESGCVCVCERHDVGLCELRVCICASCVCDEYVCVTCV